MTDQKGHSSVSPEGRFNEAQRAGYIAGFKLALKLVETVETVGWGGKDTTWWMTEIFAELLRYERESCAQAVESAEFSNLFGMDEADDLNETGLAARAQFSIIRAFLAGRVRGRAYKSKDHTAR